MWNRQRLRLRLLPKGNSPHPLNECGACGEDFSSARNFDLHRVGVHAYTYGEGVKMEPMREDGRRCLGVDEFEALGLALDKRGRWSHSERVAQTRARFAEAL